MLELHLLHFNLPTVCVQWWIILMRFAVNNYLCLTIYLEKKKFFFASIVSVLLKFWRKKKEKKQKTKDNWLNFNFLYCCFSLWWGKNGKNSAIKNVTNKHPKKKKKFDRNSIYCWRLKPKKKKGLFWRENECANWNH